MEKSIIIVDVILIIIQHATRVGMFIVLIEMLNIALLK